MGIMNKMRDSMRIIMISVASLFIIYIVMDWGMGYLGLSGQQGDPTIATINGQNIKLTEFNKIINIARENQKAQTGKDIEEDQMDAFRQQVWDAYINQVLLEQQVKKWNITVTDEEITNVIMGDNPPDFLKRSFIDSTGNFNRQAYDRAIKDPRNAGPIGQAREYIKQQQIQEKLQAIVNASVVIPESDVMNKFKEQNLKADANFIFWDVNKIQDNQVSVNDDDLKKYYNENIDKYKIEAQRKLKYVLFREQPSKSDSAFVLKSAERYAEELKSGVEFTKLSKSVSTKPYAETPIRPGSFPKETETKLFSAKVGDVVGPVYTYEGLAIFKVIKDSVSKEEFVSASHILVSFAKMNNDSTAALNKTKQILADLKAGKDFKTLAMQNSDDPGSAQNGGELGTFGKGAMVPEFEKAAFSAKVGEIVGPVKTNYGYHIIKTTAKINRLPIVAEISLPIKTSSQTKDDIYNQAQDFEYQITKGNQQFEKEAELNKIQIAETTPFNDKSEFVPGIGANRELVKFAFDNDLNDVSEVTKILGGYVIVKISDVVNEGVKKFEEVKETIKPEVIKKKKLDLLFTQAGKLRSNIKSGDSLSYFSRFDPSLKMQNTGPFNFGQFVGAGVGRDFAFLSEAFKIKIGEISQPIKGQRGIYVIQVLSRNEFDQKAYDLQKLAIRNQMLQEKKSNAINQWISDLRKKADITDNRNKYFR